MVSHHLNNLAIVDYMCFLGRAKKVKPYCFWFCHYHLFYTLNDSIKRGYDQDTPQSRTLDHYF